MPRRKGVLRRLPSSFDAISLGERLRWSRGQPCIEERVEPQPESWGLVWPGWAAWAEVYGKYREAFLAHCAQRPHLPLPASERLYEAILAGRDPEGVRAELKHEMDLNDPRIAMGWIPAGPDASAAQAAKAANDGDHQSHTRGD